MNENRNFRNYLDRIIICRTSQDTKQSLGVGICLDKSHNIVYKFRTLELPNRDNQVKTSRIPVGSYQCRKHFSPRFKECLEIQGVVGRTNILIHAGNFYKNTLGCVLVGDMLKDINADGFTDVINSKITLSHLLNLCPDSFLLIVK